MALASLLRLEIAYAQTQSQHRFLTLHTPFLIDQAKLKLRHHKFRKILSGYLCDIALLASPKDIITAGPTGSKNRLLPKSEEGIA